MLNYLEHNVIPYICRKNIREKFNKIINYPMTIINGGIGFGKTAAINQFIKEQENKFAFVQISLYNTKDSVDYFWSRFCRGVGKHDPVLGTTIEKMGFPTNIQEVMRILDYCRENMQEQYKTIIVVDDYQNFNEPLIDLLFETILRYPIAVLSVVIISRELPNFCINDYCSKGLCQIITNQDLLFSKEETKKYIELCGLNLTSTEIKKIYSQTDGWITAIYLIVEGLKNNIDLDEINTISNLIETAVYNKLDEEIKKCLIVLSFLSDFSSDEVNYIFDDNLASQKLNQALNDQFLIYYNKKTERYSLHTLFKSFLQNKSKLIGFCATEYINKAGDFYLKKNITQSFYYYTLTENHEKILEFINTNEEYVMSTLQYQIITKIYKDNQKYILKYPMAALKYCCYDNFFENRINTYFILRILEDYFINNMQSTPEIKDVNRIIGEIYLIKTMVEDKSMVFVRQNILKAKEYLNEKPTSLHFENGFFSYGCPTLLMIYTRDLNYTYTIENDVWESLLIYSDLVGNPARGCKELFFAEYYLFCQNYEKLIEYANKTLSIAMENKNDFFVLSAVFIYIRNCIAQGEYEKALEIFTTFKRQYKALQTPVYKNCMDIVTGYISSSTGLVEKIPGWVLNNYKQNNLMVRAEHIAVLITVKALIIKGDFQEAEKICQSKLLEFEYYGLPLLTLYLKLFKSICKFYFGDFKQAEELCLNAINMIKTTDIEKSYTLPFAENAVFLKDILLTLSKKPKDKETDDFIKQIFEICNITYDKITIKYKQLLVKKANNQYSYLNVDKGLSFKQSPLSDREKEVIALLSKGLTREEISKSLFISQSTVKTYLNNIYKKYDVNNKVSAILAAKKEGII